MVAGDFWAENDSCILTAEQVLHLLRRIDTSTITGLRDLAIIGLLVYGCSSVTESLRMRVGDYCREEDEAWLRIPGRGGKYHHVPIPTRRHCISMHTPPRRESLATWRGRRSAVSPSTCCSHRVR